MQKGKTMIDELMEKLLEEPVVDNNEIVFTSRAVELIHEISEKCKGIQIVEQTRNRQRNMLRIYLQRKCTMICSVKLWMLQLLYT